MTPEQIRALALQLYAVVFDSDGVGVVNDLAALPPGLPTVDAGARDGHVDQ